MSQRNKLNIAVDWYIQKNCINCSASRTVAPGLIVEQEGQSVFAKQPTNDEEIKQAWRASIVCPVQAVQTKSHLKKPNGIFPEEMTKNIYRLGYNSPTSYGAHAFLLRRLQSNIMVDGPNFHPDLLAKLEEWGGISDILLTHKDDVGDAKLFAKHFAAKVWIHQADQPGASFADQILKGENPFKIASDLMAIPIPGHTKGSVAYLYRNRFLFTGDSLAWDFDQKDLMAWREQTWHS